MILIQLINDLHNEAYLYEYYQVMYLMFHHSMEVHLPSFNKEHILFHRYLKKIQHLFFIAFLVIDMQDFHKKT